jgi:hypothetical protein
MKGGAPVSQWVTLEYVFRLANSSIFEVVRMENIVTP